jgi:hypothetical protein
LSPDQPPLNWRKSTKCASSSCIEAANFATGYAVRDSEDPAGPSIQFDNVAWEAFVRGIRSGTFHAN